ncbi:MAG: long-chain fatty acid--CoA ligase [Ardenticatenaceae bacterium]|nr:long-chain fatty acid--CoA ligase [Ardenticatenaceae bacterium]
MTTDTVLHRLHANGRNRPNAPAYYTKIGAAWVPTPWHEFLNQVRQAARALITLGLEPGGAACILGFNRPEWVIFDLAAMLAGGVPAGIYTTNSPQECKYIIEHSQSSVVLVENEHQWQKIKAVRDDIATLKHIVLMQGTNIDDSMTLSWENFMAEGNKTSEEKVDARLNSLQLDQLATLIYTSGTTGPPKGVMLSHGNLAWTAQSAVPLFDLRPTDSVLSYLPLSHIAEQMFTIHASVTVGFQVYYAQYPPQDHLNSNFREVQPTLVFGVPRIWERFASGVQDKLALSTGIKAKIANWAQDVGKRGAQVRHQGKELSGLLGFQHNLAEKLVFSTVKEGLGLTQARICITAAAPIAPEIVDFFNTFNIPLCELYGQSEDCGPTTTNLPNANKIGSVGRIWPGVEVKLGEDGEILVKGPNVFQGYYKDPAATESDLVNDWLHSGDLGEFDADGYLKIVGRKKEIIITSGGKNIAPKNIEAALKNIDLVSQAVVIGEQRRFLTALITLNPEAAQRFAEAHNLEGKTIHQHPMLIAHMQKEIDEKVNTHFARVEQVRGFKVLPRDFTVEDGELTPTLKIKRRIINENFADEIESLYE